MTYIGHFCYAAARPENTIFGLEVGKPRDGEPCHTRGMPMRPRPSSRTGIAALPSIVICLAMLEACGNDASPATEPSIGGKSQNSAGVASGNTANGTGDGAGGRGTTSESYAGGNTSVASSGSAGFMNGTIDARGGTAGSNGFTTNARGGAAGSSNSAGSSSVAGGSGRVLLRADFQGRTPGNYTQPMVGEDFAGKATWNNGLTEGRATIVDESGNRFLRITYAAGVYGPADGGVQFLVPLVGSFDELYLSYRVRFATGFDFVRGGKLPGLVGGTHPTGCVTDTAGFSARMMWRPAGACVQYMYYPEKVNSCGDDFPYRIGSTAVTFSPGAWHRVQHRIRMNTPGEKNGILQAWFDGALALDNQAFIYRIATESFAIDALYFSTFFGGSDGTWAPSTAQIADFDDFVVSERPIE